VTELQGPKTAGVLIIKLYGLKFEHVLGLGTFGTLDHLKLHRLFFGQGAKTFALDGAVMHKHIRPGFPGDKAKALGVIEPLYCPSFLHGETSYRYCNDIPAKKAGRTAVRQKKIGREIAPPSDSCPGLAALLQSDMLNLLNFTKKLLNVKEN
jgi:hypothetical protein